MTRRLRSESGFALIGALLILVIMMGIGIALVALTDTQQNQSGSERTRESSFGLAEAALNAQALQLGRTWPTSTTADCDPTTSNTGYCPLASALANSFTSSDYARSCPTAVTPPPLWRTQVRDNGLGEYWSPSVTSQPSYDFNKDNTVWVRSFATVQCMPVSIVGLVSNTSTPITVSSSVVTANWLATSNQGKKVIVDTLGAYAQPPSIRPGAASQPSKVTLRCNTPAPTPCANYSSSKGQIQPPTVQTGGSVATQMLSATQLQTLEQQAAAAGSLWTSGNCPPNNDTTKISSPASGAPVVIQGHCDISETGNGSVNSSATPGVLIVEDGTLTLGGTVNFYGLIYMMNKQGLQTSVVTIGGNAVIQGAVSVDGLGGVTAGSSKTNLIFDPRVLNILRGSTGATVSRGSVRVLPPSTP